MKLYNHQQRFVSGYKGSNILVHEAGTGKTVCACMWLKDGRDRDALVVCPKRVVSKWKDELRKWGAMATVISKEEFSKLSFIKKWSALVIDEADEFCSPLFTRQRSARTESMYNFVKKFPTMPVLLLSATIVRSNPWNLHTALCLSGKYIDWKKWRDHFFVFEKRPYMPRYAWFPRRDWRERTVPFLKKHCDIVYMRECVGELPPITEEVVSVKNPPFDCKDWEGSKAFSEEHQHEQRLKAKPILDIAKGYRKVLVVANYREQLFELEKELSKDRKTYTVMGSVKDQEKLLKEANDTEDECFLLVQASLGAGWDANSFSIVVFASMSYAVRDFVQMKARVRRVHDLHPVKYVYLLGGRCDKAVKKQIELGKTFVPSEWCECNE